MIFDYTAAAARAGIRPEALKRLREFVSAEFPGDEMMTELHLLRIIRSIERGDTTIEQVLRQELAS